jgi:putative chitinase
MIAPDREQFFASVRSQLFGGSMTGSQVAGVNAVLAAWDAGVGIDPRFVAYSLATAFHETAKTMQPIEEIGRCEGRPYGWPAGPDGQIYFGRGYVQLTWLANYQKVGSLIGVDLVNHPELALKPDMAAEILTRGMAGGWFTGRKLGDYFGGARSDWVDARRIINGVDRAALIAGYALHFLDAIEG